MTGKRLGIGILAASGSLEPFCRGPIGFNLGHNTLLTKKIDGVSDPFRYATIESPLLGCGDYPLRLVPIRVKLVYFGASTITMVRPSNLGCCSMIAMSSVSSAIR